MPELGFFAPPAINNSPRRIAHDAAPRHVIDVVKKMKRTADAAASILGITSRHKKSVVHPCPDDACLDVFARLHRIPDGYEGLNVIVALTWINPHFPRVSP